MKNKKVNKKKRKISLHRIIGIILLIFSIVLCVMVSLLDILPTKYYLLLLIAIIIINIPIDMILFRKKAKKYKRNIAFGFSTLVILAMTLPILYMGRTLAFLWWGIGDTDYKIANYSLVVLKDSDYDKVEDVKNKSVGYYENATSIEKAQKKLLSNVKVTYQSYDSLESIGQSLLDKKIDAILIEDSLLNMINEDNEKFSSSTKVIYTFKVTIKSVNGAKDVNVISEPFNIYITGIDTYGDISSVSRSDVNIIMTVNPKTKQILLTSIPRDYYVQLHGKSGTKDKLTHAGIYGTDMSISTIEDLLDTEINYYIKVNFSSFIDIIDAIGGVDVYSKYTFTSIDNFHYTQGYNKMNGEQALSFARERKAFAEGDRQRGADQQAVIEAIIRKICSKSILTKYDSLLNSIEGEFQTNMSYKKITSMIKMQLNDMATWNVTSIGLEGSDGREYTYTGGNQKLYVMIPDQDSINQASSMIESALKGEKLDGSYEKSTGKSNTVSKGSASSGTSSVKKNTTSNQNNDVNSKSDAPTQNNDKSEEVDINEDTANQYNSQLDNDAKKDEEQNKNDNNISDTNSSINTDEDDNIDIDDESTDEENSSDSDKEVET